MSNMKRVEKLLKQSQPKKERKQMIEIQKALHLYLDEEKKNPKHIGQEYMVFEKHDGWFGYLDIPSFKIHSRAGREIPSLQHLSDKLRSVAPSTITRGRLIFEIMIEGLEYDNFHKLNGILNRKDEDAEEVYLRVHDFLPEFQVDSEAQARYKYAEHIVKQMNTHELTMSTVLGVSSDPIVWKELAEKVQERSGEGVILKRTDAPYSPKKRNADLMKIKEEVTLDLKVIGTYEGEGKYAGSLGGIVVQGKNGVVHNISGMTDEERKVWWAAKEVIVGKVVEVKAMKILTDGSLREPRFKSVRYDKSVEEID